MAYISTWMLLLMDMMWGWAEVIRVMRTVSRISRNHLGMRNRNCCGGGCVDGGCAETWTGIFSHYIIFTVL